MFSTFGASDSEEEDEEIGFLSLPNECMTRVFSNLNIADRLNAAYVNRRLNEAEKAGKYYTRKLHIEMEVRFNWKTFKDRALNPQDGNEYKYHLLNEFEDFSCLERVFSNTTFGAVHVHFHEDRRVYRRLIDLIRGCDAPDVSMEIEDRSGFLGDRDDYSSLLLDLAKNRRSFVFQSHRKARLLEEGFQILYQAIHARSIGLESLEIHGYACMWVIESIGLIVGSPDARDSLWSGDPTQFEAFEDNKEGLIIFHKRVRVFLPSGFDRNPQSIYFRIYEKEEEMEEEKEEIKESDDHVRRRVNPLN